MNVTEDERAKQSLDDPETAPTECSQLDNGWRAWMVLISSFIMIFLSEGLMYTYLSGDSAARNDPVFQHEPGKCHSRLFSHGLLAIMYTHCCIVNQNYWTQDSIHNCANNCSYQFMLFSPLFLQRTITINRWKRLVVEGRISPPPHGVSIITHALNACAML